MAAGIILTLFFYFTVQFSAVPEDYIIAPTAVSSTGELLWNYPFYLSIIIMITKYAWFYCYSCRL